MKTLKKPEMFNRFHDPETDLTFTIPAEAQVSNEEAFQNLAVWKKNQRQKLLDDWKKRPQNKDWTGDDEAKKSELFVKLYPPGSEMILVRPTGLDKTSNP